MECEVYVDGIYLECVSVFKYLGMFSKNQEQMGQSLVGRWRAGGGLQRANRSIVNAIDLAS